MNEKSNSMESAIVSEFPSLIIVGGCLFEQISIILGDFVDVPS